MTGGWCALANDLATSLDKDDMTGSLSLLKYMDEADGSVSRRRHSAK